MSEARSVGGRAHRGRVQLRDWRGGPSGPPPKATHLPHTRIKKNPAAVSTPHLPLPNAACPPCTRSLPHLIPASSDPATPRPSLKFHTMRTPFSVLGNATNAQPHAVAAPGPGKAASPVEAAVAPTGPVEDITDYSMVRPQQGKEWCQSGRDSGGKEKGLRAPVRARYRSQPPRKEKSSRPCTRRLSPVPIYP